MDLRIKVSPTFTEASIKHLAEFNLKASKHGDAFAMFSGKNTSPQNLRSDSNSNFLPTIAMSVGNNREGNVEFNELLLSKCINFCEKHQGKEFDDASVLEKFKRSTHLYNKLLHISKIFDADLAKLTNLEYDDLSSLLERESEIEEILKGKKPKINISKDSYKKILGEADFF